MRIELTPDQASVLRPLLESRNTFDRQLVIGQFVKRQLARTRQNAVSLNDNQSDHRKIRKLIQKERANAKGPNFG